MSLYCKFLYVSCNRGDVDEDESVGEGEDAVGVVGVVGGVKCNIVLDVSLDFEFCLGRLIEYETRHSKKSTDKDFILIELIPIIIKNQM